MARAQLVGSRAGNVRADWSWSDDDRPSFASVFPRLGETTRPGDRSRPAGVDGCDAQRALHGRETQIMSSS